MEFPKRFGHGVATLALTLLVSAQPTEWAKECSLGRKPQVSRRTNEAPEGRKISSSFSFAPPGLRPVGRQVYLMGTRCRLEIYASDQRAGLRQLESFIAILEETEKELSTWRGESVLSRLNRQPVGVPFRVDSRLCGLFKQLHHWNERTGRAFDPGIGNLIQAWGLQNGGRRPSDADVASAAHNSGLRYFRLQERDCQIIRTREVRIDAGAFGKGEALDRALQYSVENAADPWLIDLGGQVMVYGLPPETHAWEVELAHPLDRQRPVRTLALRNGSLSTSGGSERDLHLDGRRIGHILNPITGRPADFEGSVAVWHDSAFAADALSTALYVMGPEHGLLWADEKAIAACFLISQKQGVESRASRAFSHLFDSH